MRPEVSPVGKDTFRGLRCVYAAMPNVLSTVLCKLLCFQSFWSFWCFGFRSLRSCRMGESE